MPSHSKRHWKRALRRLLPILFTKCPFGTDHWVFERWCLCKRKGASKLDGTSKPGSQHDGVFDLRRWEEARQGPEGHRPGNTNVQLGDYVQPEGLELRPPLAWKVVGFEARGSNPKYRVVLEYPLSGDRLTLANLPRNTRPPGEANDPERLDRLSEIRERRVAGEISQAAQRRPSG
jgi:hypothetical protein